MLEHAVIGPVVTMVENEPPNAIRQVQVLEHAFVRREDPRSEQNLQIQLVQSRRYLCTSAGVE